MLIFVAEFVIIEALRTTDEGDDDLYCLFLTTISALMTAQQG